MTSLTDLVLAHRRVVLVAWLVLAVAGGWAASGLSGVLSQSFDAPGRPAFEANREIVERLGSGGLTAPIVPVVALPRGAQAADPSTARELERAFTRVAEAVPGARLAAPADSDALVSRDGRTAYALVFPPPGSPAPDENPRALRAAEQAAGDQRVAGAPVRITGVEALSSDEGSGESIGLLVEILIGGAGALLVLIVVFASPLPSCRSSSPRSPS